MIRKTVSVALCATSVLPFLASPALATPATPIAEMAANCNQSLITPAPNSTYQIVLNTAGITSVTGAEVETGRVTVLDEPGGVLLSSTGPTYVAGTQGRNGQSPNIFGTFESVKTYSGAHKIQDVTYKTDTVFTYGCIVYKTTTNNQGTNTTTPPGIQIPGPQHAALQITKSETRTVREEFTTPPVVRTELSEAVICNSPTKNPGVWRQQNGYTGVCSTALFLSLSQIAIHSNSLPPIEPVNAPSDFTSDSVNDDSGPASLVDTETGEEVTES